MINYDNMDRDTSPTEIDDDLFNESDGDCDISFNSVDNGICVQECLSHIYI